MKALLIAMLLLGAPVVQAKTSIVHGYVTKRGKYVKPHIRIRSLGKAFKFKKWR